MARTQNTDFEAFYSQFIPRTYRKGEQIIRTDDDPQGIFCLYTGYVRQYSYSKTGMELTLNILKPVSYFPMIWAPNGTPNTYNFEALTEVEVGRAPKDQLIDFIRDKPDILYELLGELLGDYNDSLSRVEHLIFSDAYLRVISVLVYIAKHYGSPHSNGIIVLHRFTQQDIATLVGVARETTSIEMGKLEKKQLIRYRNHSIVFPNLADLEAELNAGTL